MVFLTLKYTIFGMISCECKSQINLDARMIVLVQPRKGQMYVYASLLNRFLVSGFVIAIGL